MTATAADQAIMGLARDVLADVVACQQLLALTEVRGYDRTVHGKLEHVRPFERLEGEAAHEHIGLPGDLPDDSRYDLADYKQIGYHAINELLRAPSYREAVARSEYGYRFPPERGLRNSVAHIDAAFGHAVPTAKPVAVYRGLSGMLPERITPGTVLHDSAYMSTSTVPDLARQFTEEYNQTGDRSQGRIVRITVPAGERVLSMKNLIAAGKMPALGGQTEDDEHEVLLPRDRSLKVTAVHGNTIEAEMMPAEKPESAPQPVARAQPALTPAQQALARVLAYKKAQSVAATMALSASKPSRAHRFVWRPGDIQITRPPIPSG